MSGKLDHDTAPVTEATFVEIYGATIITMGTRQLPLIVALQMEAAFCPADPDTRETEEQRLHFLAKRVGEESLRPEHAHLLNQSASN